MTDLDVFQPPCCNSNPMVYFEPHDRLGDPYIVPRFLVPTAGNTQADETLPWTLVGAVRIVGSHLGRIPNFSEVPGTMYFIGGGGGFGGRGALPADNTPAQQKPPLNPPKPPPLYSIWLWGGFKHDIRFPRAPPPLVGGARGIDP